MRAGVSARSIRHYERAGLLRATRRPNGYRDFDATAAERVRAIRDLVATGFTIDEVGSLAACLDESIATTGCCAKTRAAYEAKLARIDEQVRTLTAVRHRIEQRIDALGACGG